MNQGGEVQRLLDERIAEAVRKALAREAHRAVWGDHHGPAFPSTQLKPYEPVR